MTQKPALLAPFFAFWAPLTVAFGQLVTLLFTNTNTNENDPHLIQCITADKRIAMHNTPRCVNLAIASGLLWYILAHAARPPLVR